MASSGISRGKLAHVVECPAPFVIVLVIVILIARRVSVECVPHVKTHLDHA